MIWCVALKACGGVYFNTSGKRIRPRPHQTLCVFIQSIQGIQKIISELMLSNYSNLGQLVAQVDSKLEKILATRLEQLIDVWVAEFENWPHAGTILIPHGSLHEFKVQSRVSIQCLQGN